MEFNKKEVEVVRAAEREALDLIVELEELQLGLIGGGVGEVIVG